MSASTDDAPLVPLARAGAVRLEGLVNRTSALPIALAMALGVAAGDYATGADVAFTLLYLVPIGVASWYRGRSSSVAVAVFCVALWLGVGVINAPHKVSRDMVLLWNTLGQAGVFLAFATLLQSLRTRIATEVHGRESAVDQLRHAERLTTVGILASGIAHELGTPLNVISGRASLIASERVTGAGARTSAAIIVEQTSRMAGIIRGLLDFARRSSPGTALVDVDRLTRDTVALLLPLAKRRGCSIAVSASTSAIAAIDGGELQQVLTNLLMNAVQASPAGGQVAVTVDVGPAADRPAHARRAKSYVTVRVRDHGTGIPASVLPHVFDPFFTTKDVGEGTGLGLSVAFGIIRDHGGWIEAKSRVGEGSEFVVHLPQAAEA